MKLLIAEDEEQIRLGMQYAIDWKELGFDQVYTAGDGLEALRLCMKHQPELVMTDIMMPGITGLELGKRLTEMYRPLYLLIFT